MSQNEVHARHETAPLGEMSVPAIALYGVQTQRALDNFRVSNLRIHPALITAYVEIKHAAAEANRATGALKPELANAIIRVAEELSAGHWHDQFQLDVFQAGAGASRALIDKTCSAASLGRYKSRMFRFRD